VNLLGWYCALFVLYGCQSHKMFCLISWGMKHAEMRYHSCLLPSQSFGQFWLTNWSAKFADTYHIDSVGYHVKWWDSAVHCKFIQRTRPRQCRYHSSKLLRFKFQYFTKWKLHLDQSMVLSEILESLLDRQLNWKKKVCGYCKIAAQILTSQWWYMLLWTLLAFSPWWQDVIQATLPYFLRDSLSFLMAWSQGHWWLLQGRKKNIPKEDLCLQWHSRSWLMHLPQPS